MEPSKTAAVAQTYGELIEGLYKIVKDENQQAAEKNDEARIKAGQELEVVIGQFENGNKGLLSYTVAKVSEKAKTALEQLTTIVSKFQKKEELQGISTILKDLPSPIVITAASCFVVISGVAKEGLIVLKGYFPIEKGHEPSFWIDKKICPLVKCAQDELTFSVSVDTFKNDAVTQYAIKQGILQIDKKNPGWLWDGWDKLDYRMSLAALPQEAGKIEVEFTKMIHKVQPMVFKHSYCADERKKQEKETFIETIKPRKGWIIDHTKEPLIIVEHIHGKHSIAIKSISSEKIVLEAELHCRPDNDRGIMSVVVNFQEVQDKPAEEKRVEKFGLNWRDQILFKPQEGEVISKMTFIGYNGVKQVFEKPKMDEGILQVEAVGGGWKTSLQLPKNLGIKEAIKEKLEDKKDAKDVKTEEKKDVKDAKTSEEKK